MDLFNDIETRLLALNSGPNLHLAIACNEKAYGPGQWASPQDKIDAEASGRVWSLSYNTSSSPKHLHGIKVYASSLHNLLDAVGALTPL